MSLSSFVYDVAEAFADFVNRQTEKFAATGAAEYPLVAPEGGKEPLRAEFAPYSMGSDHDVYQDSSFRIPAIYMNDWPDRYIHTNFDSSANIDPTKLKRAAFIGAASGYFLAQLTSKNSTPYESKALTFATLYLANALLRKDDPADEDGINVVRMSVQYILDNQRSLDSFLGRAIVVAPPGSWLPQSWGSSFPPAKPAQGDGLLVFKRNSEPKGPLAVFGYDYFTEHAKAAGIPTPKLLNYQGLWGGGEEYAYETLNFADGKRNAQQIRDAVSAEYGPVPLEMVEEYLRALEKIGVVTQVNLQRR
jgi:hypothetical protein